jgi:hypothetical protein
VDDVNSNPAKSRVSLKENSLINSVNTKYLSEVPTTKFNSYMLLPLSQLK